MRVLSRQGNYPKLDRLHFGKQGSRRYILLVGPGYGAEQYSDLIEVSFIL
jgi:hypothetical protein